MKFYHPEAYDRGGKFRLYSHNPVLQDYLLVSSTSIEIDLYHKKDNGELIIINYKEGDMIELKSINLTFAIAQIYRGLTLTPETEYDGIFNLNFLDWGKFGIDNFFALPCEGDSQIHLVAST